MNAHTSTNSSFINLSALTATIEKNVADIAAQAAEKAKIVEAAKTVRALANEEKAKLDLVQKMGSEQVSAIQAGIAKSVKDSRKAVETKCRLELARLGVINPDSYKIDDVIDAIDTKAFTPALEIAGELTAKAFEFGNGIKNRFLKGFSK